MFAGVFWGLWGRAGERGRPFRGRLPCLGGVSRRARRGICPLVVVSGLVSLPLTILVFLIELLKVTILFLQTSMGNYCMSPISYRGVFSLMDYV